MFFLRAGTDEDIEYYVRECGNILGVSNKLSGNSKDARSILEYIFAQVVEFKKLNQVEKKCLPSVFHWSKSNGGRQFFIRWTLSICRRLKLMGKGNGEKSLNNKCSVKHVKTASNFKIKIVR